MHAGLFLVLALSQAPALLARPNYIDCVDSSECGIWECCVLGMGRFSLPRCQALKDVGDSCRPGLLGPINTTVSYPDGQAVMLPAVFLGSCPCAPGLACGDGVCHDPTEHEQFNAL